MLRKDFNIRWSLNRWLWFTLIDWCDVDFNSALGWIYQLIHSRSTVGSSTINITFIIEMRSHIIDNSFSRWNVDFTSWLEVCHSLLIENLLFCRDFFVSLGYFNHIAHNLITLVINIDDDGLWFLFIIYNVDDFSLIILATDVNDDCIFTADNNTG